MAFFGASDRYRLFSPSGYNIPKPKFLYYVRFITTFLEEETLRNVSFFIRSIDRIQLDYDVQEMNQYNKKRLVQTKIAYGPLNFILHDTVDETALKLVEAYNRYYFGDFEEKNNRSWAYDIMSANFETTDNWGLKGNFTPNDSYFFDRIEIYEIYDQTYSQINFINPKFTSVNFQNLDKETSATNEVSITCRYEGVVVDKVGEPVTEEIADRVGLPLNNTLGIGVNGYRVPGVSSLVPGASAISNLGSSVFNNLINSAGFTGGSTNPVNNLLNPAVTPFTTTINPLTVAFGSRVNSTLAGNMVFDTIQTTGGFLQSVETRRNSGEIVRDVATATINRASRNLVI